MLKKLTVILLLLTIVLSAVPVSAAGVSASSAAYRISESHDRFTSDKYPVIYKSTIKVTEYGGIYKVGFVEIIFKKDFIKPDMLPIIFNVEISAVNGVAGIEFYPDIPQFDRDVTIRVDSYKGLLYDKTKGKNIFVQIKKQQFKVQHFSRYAFS